jgi:uridine phosphorylase
MNSIFDNKIWYGDRCYVTAEADLLHHRFEPAQANLGQACLIVFSSSLFSAVLDIVPEIDVEFSWPYSTTPLKRCQTGGGKAFTVHFPSYGGPRIANSLEQLAACGIRYVFGLGLGGTLQKYVNIGDFILLEGAVKGDGVSRYYSPVEFPAVADFELTARIREKLIAHGEIHHMGLSFGADALYREEENFIEQLRTLGVLSIDLESSAFFLVGRRLGLKCCWAGVVSDRLLPGGHEGNIHSAHVMTALLRLAKYILDVIETL